MNSTACMENDVDEKYSLLLKQSSSHFGLLAADPLFGLDLADPTPQTQDDELLDDELSSELNGVFSRLPKVLEEYNSVESDLSRQIEGLDSDLKTIQSKGTELGAKLFNDLCTVDDLVTSTEERVNMLMNKVVELMKDVGPKASEYQRITSAQAYVKSVLIATQAMEKLHGEYCSENLVEVMKLRTSVSMYPNLLKTLESCLVSSIERVLDYEGKQMQTVCKKIRWPQDYQTVGVGSKHDAAPLAQVFQSILDAQFISLLITGDKSSSTPLTAPVTIDESSNEGVLLKREIVHELDAVSALLRPVTLRFRYHFCGNRKTNRADRPEFYLGFLVQFLKGSASLVQRVVQPVAEGSTMRPWVMELVRRELPNSALALLNHGDSTIVLDVTAHIIRGLVRQVHHRVNMDKALLLENPKLMSHLVDELNSTDQILCGEFCYPGNMILIEPQVAKTWPVLITALCDEAASEEAPMNGTPGQKATRLFTSWIAADLQNAQERLKSALEDPHAWVSLDEKVAASIGATGDAEKSATASSSTPESCSVLLDMLDTIRQRFMFASNEDSFRCASAILAPLLLQYLEEVRRAAQEQMATQLTPKFPALNAAYVVLLTLQDWMETNPQFVKWQRLYLQHIDRVSAELDMKRREQGLLGAISSNSSAIGKRMTSSIQQAGDSVKSDVMKASGKVSNVMSVGGIGSTALLRSLGVTSAVSRAFDATSKTLTSSEMNNMDGGEIEPKETSAQEKPPVENTATRKKTVKSMFGDALEQYQLTIDTIMRDHVVGITLSEFQADSVTYVNKVRAWGASQTGRVQVPNTITPTFGEAVSRLKSRLGSIQRHCHPDLQLSIVKEVAKGLSKFLIEKLILGIHFGYLGSLQLALDINFLIGSFAAWSKTPEKFFFRRLHETLKVLTLPLNSMTSLCRALKGLGWDRKHRDPTEENSIQDILERGNGWWEISASDVKKLSGQRSDFVEQTRREELS